MASDAVDKHLQDAWEVVRELSDFRKYELVDFIRYLRQQEEEDTLGLCEEDIQAVERLLNGDEKAAIPWEQVKREMREAEDRVRD